MAKLEIQMLSLPSTATAQGPGRPPPVKGEPGIWRAVRAQQRDAAAVRPPFCFAIVRVSVSSTLPPSFSGRDHVDQTAASPRNRCRTGS